MAAREQTGLEHCFGYIAIACTHQQSLSAEAASLELLEWAGTTLESPWLPAQRGMKTTQFRISMIQESREERLLVNARAVEQKLLHGDKFPAPRTHHTVKASVLRLTSDASSNMRCCLRESGLGRLWRCCDSRSIFCACLSLRWGSESGFGAVPAS